METASLKHAGAFLVLLLLGAQNLPAPEKGSIAQQAEAIAVARLTGARSFPWFDGWHLRGTLTIRRTLWGPAKPGANLKYEFVCSGCPFWPRPEFEFMTKIDGLWFVNHAAGSSWTPNSLQGGDPGFRYLEDLPYFESLVSRRKSTDGPYR